MEFSSDDLSNEWRGEHGQTMILERNLSLHRSNLSNDEEKGQLRPSGDSAGSFSSNSSTPLLRRSGSSIPRILENYGSEQEHEIQNTIRFQIVVWYVGKVDVVQGRVPMTFRITLFWNDVAKEEDEQLVEPQESESVSSSKFSHTVWRMHGRQQAFQKELKDTPLQAVDVPPISILNVVSFDTIGSPEVSMLREDTKLMRWSCMYRADVIQQNMRVDRFPHDRHEISLKLGILAHRSRGSRWDRNVWKLSLATEQDSQGSTRIPYGLVVDQVNIPDFHFLKEKGLRFDFVPLAHGALAGSNKQGGRDQCLEVKFTVERDSGYYDKNIMPLLVLLNTVAICILWLDASMFFQRALLSLNIAFVEIGIRMTVDSHLPSVGYQIKMQRLLNEFFCGLLCLVLEGMFVYALYHSYGFSLNVTDSIDVCAAVCGATHLIVSVISYYSDTYRASK